MGLTDLIAKELDPEEEERAKATNKPEATQSKAKQSKAGEQSENRVIPFKIAQV